MSRPLEHSAARSGAGTYVSKPHDQWHTLWNPRYTDELWSIELLPGGFDGCFERLSRPGSASPALWLPHAIAALALDYGIGFDFDSSPDVCVRFDLTFA